MTALMFAGRRGDLTIVQYLVEHGANINATDSVIMI